MNDSHPPWTSSRGPANVDLAPEERPSPASTSPQWIWSGRAAGKVLEALPGLNGRVETSDLFAAALGDQRRREFRTQGAAMSMDEAISYALANIDPKLLTNLVTSLEPTSPSSPNALYGIGSRCDA